MARTVKALIAFLLVALPALASAEKPADTSPEHMEATVRHTYGALALMCSLGLVMDPARFWPENITQYRVVGDKIPEPPTFEITNLTSGTILSVANRKYKEFTDLSSGPKLVINSASFDDDEGGVVSTWQYAQLHWETRNLPEGINDNNSVLGWTMQAIVDYGSKQFTVPATYTHYVAFIVNAKFDGKETGPHKAVFFFGHDAKGNEVVAPEDELSGDQGLWFVLQNQELFPTGLLASTMRTNKYLAKWIKDNTVQDSSCSEARPDFCCHDGRCGLAESKVGHDLAMPLVKSH